MPKVTQRGNGCAGIRTYRDRRRSSPVPPHPETDAQPLSHPGLPAPHILGREDPRATNRASFQARAGAKPAATSPSDLAKRPLCCGSHRGHSPPALEKEWPASCPSAAARAGWTPPCRPREQDACPAAPSSPASGAQVARLCFPTHEITQKGRGQAPLGDSDKCWDSRPRDTFTAKQYPPQPTAQAASGPTEQWQRSLMGGLPVPHVP